MCSPEARFCDVCGELATPIGHATKHGCGGLIRAALAAANARAEQAEADAGAMRRVVDAAVLAASSCQAYLADTSGSGTALLDACQDAEQAFADIVAEYRKAPTDAGARVARQLAASDALVGALPGCTFADCAEPATERLNATNAYVVRCAAHGRALGGDWLWVDMGYAAALRGYLEARR
jgi:hypothetical protein